MSFMQKTVVHTTCFHLQEGLEEENKIYAEK